MTAEGEKKLAGEAAAEFVTDGMAIGLGTGTTVRYFIERVGTLVKKGIKVTGVPTSVQTEKLAKKSGIRTATLEEHPRLDLAVDGADEVDPRLDLIKGLGGALFREKIVAKAAKRFIVVVDSSKLVAVLGEQTPVPVEVHVFGWKATMEWLRALGCTPTLRRQLSTPYITDNGNFILDCSFGRISNPAELERKINNTPGVAQNGIFVGMANLVIVGKGYSVERMERPR